MTTPLDWIRDAAAKAPPPVRDGVNTAVDAAEGVVFADGSLPAGTNPADIYSWFHDGPGTTGYEHASATLDALAGTFPDYTEQVRAAQREVETGWHGASAEKSVQSFQKLLDAAATLTGHATNAGRSVSAQVTSFNETKARVVPVPAQPPVGPGMNQFTQPFAPANYSADAQVAGYQVATYNNQDAYGGYQGQTTPQGTSLPQDGAAKDPKKPTVPGDPPDPAPPGPTPTPGQPGNPPPGSQNPPGSPNPPGQNPPGSQNPPGQNPPGSRTPPGSQTPPGTAPPGTPANPSDDKSVYTDLPPSVRDGAVTDPSQAGAGTRPPGFTAPPSSLSGNANSPGSGGYESSGWASGGPGPGLGGSAPKAGAGRFSGVGRPGAEPMSGRGAGGRASAAGAPGMGAGPAGGRGGDDDRERDSKYLLATDHESEFVGDLPSYSPSVIGEWRDDDDE